MSHASHDSIHLNSYSIGREISHELQRVAAQAEVYSRTTGRGISHELQRVAAQAEF